MAHYSYKSVQIPDWFENNWIEEQSKIWNDFEYEGDPNYNGDKWDLVAAYIDYLEQEIVKLNAAAH